MGRFWRSKDGCCMNWLEGSKKTEKPLSKCCSPDTKESLFYIALPLAMKSWCILTILCVKDRMLSPAKGPNRPQGRIVSERGQCSVFSGISVVLYNIYMVWLSTTKSNRYWWSLPTTFDRFEPFYTSKTSGLLTRQHKVIFFGNERIASSYIGQQKFGTIV